MASQTSLYMAQITDVHVGRNTLNGNAARQYLPLAELAGLTRQPRCIPATADLVYGRTATAGDAGRGRRAGAADSALVGRARRPRSTPWNGAWRRALVPHDAVAALRSAGRLALSTGR